MQADLNVISAMHTGYAMHSTIFKYVLYSRFGFLASHGTAATYSCYTFLVANFIRILAVKEL